MFRGYAVIVTTSTYQSPDVPDLGTSVVADGDDIETVLSDTDLCGYDPGHISRLEGDQATAQNILNALANLESQASPDDPVFFYFSGHGMEAVSGVSSGSSLVAHDFDLRAGIGFLDSTLLSQAIGRIQSNRKLLVIDACHSGGVSIAKSAGPQVKLIHGPDLLDRLAEGRGSVAVASSRPDETSVIMPSDRNSLFTKHLIDGLKGHAGHDADGFVGVFDLFTYTAERVRSEYPNQHPNYSAQNQDSNFPISYCASPARRKSRRYLSRPSTLTNNVSDLVHLLPELYPLGPRDSSVWERSGGDLSRLTLVGNGRNDWFQALKLLRSGGGGYDLSYESLLTETLQDYPNHPRLKQIRSAIRDPV